MSLPGSPQPGPPPLGPLPVSRRQGEPQARRRRWVYLLLIPLGAVTGVAVLIGVGYFLLAYAFNPLADEWVCSEGEAPASSGCYPVDEPLPAGVHWDPLGNRPMPYNCDKRGWSPIAKDGRDDVRDCLSDHLPVPDGWHLVE